MRIKRVSPQKIFKFVKKGKRRGRPSKVELMMAKIADYLYEKTKSKLTPSQ